MPIGQDGHQMPTIMSQAFSLDNLSSRQSVLCMYHSGKESTVSTGRAMRGRSEVELRDTITELKVPLSAALISTDLA